MYNNSLKIILNFTKNKSVGLLRYVVVFALCSVGISHAQERQQITIDYAPSLEKDALKFPGGTILTRDKTDQVSISHNGIKMWCDQAIHYAKDNYIEAYGNVLIQQGDSIEMSSDFVDYSGKTELAIASGGVVLKDPTSTIFTEKLYFDRSVQEAFYRENGRVEQDTTGTITSRIGRYYMNDKKYQFVDSVHLVNEKYIIDSQQLDFYSERSHAYLFGPTTIKSKDSRIYCERGFYDTKRDLGYFLKDAKLYYNHTIVQGDSLYFDRSRKYASAVNHIQVTDTLNHTVVRGHFAEIFREKDSMYITKRALAIGVQENDSIYVHSDSIKVIGPPDHRITKAYYNAKIFKSNLAGKADSIHTDQASGVTKLINLDRFSGKQAFGKKKDPILWHLENQMTGDTIVLMANPKTETLDSLKVFDNAFVVSKDTIGLGFNQIKGKTLVGLFSENVLYQVDVIKNAESIYFMRNEANELIGIDVSKSGKIVMLFEDNAVEELIKYIQIGGKSYPEEDLDERDRILRGFVWRNDERPQSVEDLFKDDPPLELPVIKGLSPYVPQTEFFDESRLKAIESATPEEVKKRESEESQERPTVKPVPKNFKEMLRKKKLKQSKDQNDDF